MDDPTLYESTVVVNAAAKVEIVMKEVKNSEEKTKEYYMSLLTRRSYMISPKYEKSIWLIVACILIILIWIGSAIYIAYESLILINFKLSLSHLSNTTLALNTLISELNANDTGYYKFNCPVNYVHSNSSLYCSPSCTIGDFCSSQLCFNIQHAVLATIDITVISVSIFILITWPFVKSFHGFPQITIIFVIICLFLLAVVFALGDIPGPSYYCNANSGYSLDDVSVLFQDRLAGLGVLIHFLRISIMFWVLFALINIFISIIAPDKLRLNRKTKIIIVIVEAIIAFGVPLLFNIITLSLRSTYVFDTFGAVSGFNSPQLFMLGRVVPDFLTVAFALTLVTLIVTKLRLFALDSKQILGKVRNLSALEKRFIIYCLIYSMIFLFFLFEGIWFYTISFREFVNIFNYRACITLESPLDVYQSSGSVVRYNSTSERISASVWRNGTECDGLTPHVHDYPTEIIIIYNILYRIERLIFFFIFILKANIRVWYYWYQAIKNKMLLMNRGISKSLGEYFRTTQISNVDSITS